MRHTLKFRKFLCADYSAPIETQTFRTVNDPIRIGQVLHPVEFAADPCGTREKNVEKLAQEVRTGRLIETAETGAFVGEDVKDGEQLGDLQKIVNLLRQVEQLQFATAISHRRESANQFTDP